MTLGIECLLTDDPACADELVYLHPGRYQPRTPRHRRRHARARPWWPNRCSTKATSPPRHLRKTADPSFTKGGRHRRQPHQGQAAPPLLCVRQRAQSARNTNSRLGPLHCRISPARRAGPVGKRHPGVLKKFGGHAMAAGCTIHEDGLDTFEQALCTVARRLDAATPDAPAGYRRPGWRSNTAAPPVQTLTEVWGQGLPPPVFSEEVEVVAAPGGRKAPGAQVGTVANRWTPSSPATPTRCPGGNPGISLSADEW